MNYQTQKVLKIGDSFPVNNELAGIVPMASPDEQAILTEDIRSTGLVHPVALYKGQIVDGRCRQKACLQANVPVRAIDLDDNLTIEEVKAYVKAVNTRRNLTHAQKAMVAAKESMKPTSSVKKQAKAWAVSEVLIKNARWLLNNYPTIAQDLFDGKSVELYNGRTTNKVTTIYAYYKAKDENIAEDTEHGWDEKSFITTQAGKNWYYEQITMLDAGDNTKARMLIAELANYKFKKSSI